MRYALSGHEKYPLSAAEITGIDLTGSILSFHARQLYETNLRLIEELLERNWYPTQVFLRLRFR